MQTATYSPEDNKIRLYVGRVPRPDYERLRAAGFTSTPKQSCDFVATWTPQREDLAREFLDDGEDIGDEDYSPEERSADRAERFGDYRDKRATEAGAGADAFEAGPSAYGHQNRARAERQALRHDRRRVYAVSQWSKAEYWQTRTAAVISHRLHLSDPRTRRGRIVRLETELRRYAAAGGRWEAHLQLRLTYERAMLEAEGGTAAAVDIEPGGFFGRHQVHKVNRSSATGAVVSVGVIGPHRWRKNAAGDPLVCVQVLNVQRMAADAYRAPTDEERAAFIRETAERKAKEKAERAPGPPLINPTDEDAEKLQAIWNEAARVAHEGMKRKGYGDCPVVTVARMTQAHYSARSKGAYGSCETSDISERLRVRRTHYHDRERVTVFKVRTHHGPNYGARVVIILTDKPQKPIPWAAVDAARAKQPTEESVFHRLGELVEALRGGYEARQTPGFDALLNDFAYVGWAYCSSQSQQGLTEAGAAAYKRFEAIKADHGTPTENGILYDGAAVAKAMRPDLFAEVMQ